MLYKPLIKQPFGTTDVYNVLHRKMAAKTLIYPMITRMADSNSQL